MYTYHANRYLHDADIIAIEADPQRFQVLQDNVAKWSAGSSNRITCINAAVSDPTDAQSGEGIEFFVTGTQISGGLFSVPERSDDYAPTKVPVMQLDDLYRPNTPTTVKIDVEGVELRVLQGAKKLITSGNATFLTEVSWWGDRGRGTSSIDVLRFAFASGLRARPEIAIGLPADAGTSSTRPRLVGRSVSPAARDASGMEPVRAAAAPEDEGAPPQREAVVPLPS